ncbi:aminotransferase class I/II-fold pyridoxal phosphate-dependent enzyme [Mixta intestinalis]|uniref:HTH-type transcriptional regulator NorG n=1 Tax=Mixta intestinalis TaxID=1615494 RepID=A0A6P1PVS6_9GAMM|nr:aminotransferase class I/II-fold pyridoxal phosphate-dependent enzyme [Mixta intestinalis]QHM70211.1 HTH-type transcriptional regulator NorG [Mixta intestinalis]
MSATTTASEIFESIRIKVRTGELKAGETLPPVRELAVQLDVNRNTVASAYKKLVAAGIAVTNGRYGTIVKGPGDLPEQEGTSSLTTLKDVSGGNPELSFLPDITSLIKAVTPVPRTYGEPVMNPALAKQGMQWFSRDVPGEFGLNLTYGAIDAIERLITGFLAAGEKIAVEEPCFLSSINTIRSLGYVPLGVEVDRNGLLPEALLGALKSGAQVVLVTPRAHNPTGCSLSPQRAEEIKAILENFPHVMVIVDDHFSLLSMENYHNIIPACTHHWAIIRSVSKFLGPDLRMALVASNPETARRLGLRLASGTNWVSHILQDIVEKALASAVVRKKIKKAAGLYQSRREALLTALREQGIVITRPYDGLNVWLCLEKPPAEVVRLMEDKGWLIRSGSSFYLNKERYAIRLTPASQSDRQLKALARDLAEALLETGNAVKEE